MLPFRNQSQTLLSRSIFFLSFTFSPCSSCSLAMGSEMGKDKNSSFMVEPNTLPTPKQTQKKGFFTAQAVLRVLATLSTLGSLVIMVKSKQTVFLFGIKFEAEYSYSSAFRFLMAADIVVCGFSAVSLVSLCFLSRSTSDLRRYLVLFFLDLVIMVLMISGCAAATAIGYVGKYGEEKMGWIGLCDHVSKFCNRMSVSTVLSYIAFFCYLGLVIMTANKLTSPAPK